MLNKLWKDEDGIVALEYLLLATIVGLALVVGLSSVASALNVELVELSNAILNLDQTYSYVGHSTCGAQSAPAAVSDLDLTIAYSATTQAPVSINETVCP